MIQFSGEIIHTDKHKGIAISSQNLKRVVDLIPDTSIKGNGETYILPPILASFQIAPEGEYRIRSTGEVVVNPDLLTTWTVMAQKKHED